MQPKTIEAYSPAVRRASRYFDYQIDGLTEDQLTEYFSDLLSSPDKQIAQTRYRSLLQERQTP